MGNVKHHARRTWKAIQAKGLVPQASLALYFYYRQGSRDGGAQRPFDAMYSHTKEADRKLKAAIRAERSQGLPSKRGRPRRDAAEARADALGSPFGNGGSRATLGDALAQLQQETGRELSLEETRRILVRTAGPRSPHDERLFLVLLQELAAERNLPLAYKQLANLAACANPEKYRGEGSKRNLARDLSRLWPGARQAVRQDLLPLWRRLMIPRNEFPHLFSPLR